MQDVDIKRPTAMWDASLQLGCLKTSPAVLGCLNNVLGTSREDKEIEFFCHSLAQSPDADGSSQRPEQDRADPPPLVEM